MIRFLLLLAGVLLELVAALELLGWAGGTTVAHGLALVALGIACYLLAVSAPPAPPPR